MLSRPLLEKRRKRCKMVVGAKIVLAADEGGTTAQLMHTLDVSASGAKLGGIREPFSPGDVLTVQRNNKKANCRVIWVRQLGPTEMQMGIELIDADERFWGLDLSQEKEGAEATKSLLALLAKC
ncbi:MAG: PilZ domain-containing protein [Acidobacteriota bacterium]|nr:PilZ domain-containing protein [Acidobacteriota bacterium]